MRLSLAHKTSPLRTTILSNLDYGIAYALAVVSDLAPLALAPKRTVPSEGPGCALTLQELEEIDTLIPEQEDAPVHPLCASDLWCYMFFLIQFA